MMGPTTDTQQFDPSGDARFTEWLRETSEPAWSGATRHRFTSRLADGSLSEEAFRYYLLQDYGFVRTLVSVAGHAVGNAPTLEAQRHFIEFLDNVTDEENDYFERSFEALDVDPSLAEDPPVDAVNQHFQNLLVRCALEGGYEFSLVSILPVEWVYVRWAHNVEKSDDLPFYYREWIELHDNPQLSEFVEWMRNQLDEIGPRLPRDRQNELADRFQQVVILEEAFFDSAMNSA